MSESFKKLTFIDHIIILTTYIAANTINEKISNNQDDAHTSTYNYLIDLLGIKDRLNPQETDVFNQDVRIPVTAAVPKLLEKFKKITQSGGRASNKACDKDNLTIIIRETINALSSSELIPATEMTSGDTSLFGNQYIKDITEIFPEYTLLDAKKLSLYINLLIDKIPESAGVDTSLCSKALSVSLYGCIKLADTSYGGTADDVKKIELKKYLPADLVDDQTIFYVACDNPVLKSLGIKQSDKCQSSIEQNREINTGISTVLLTIAETVTQKIPIPKGKCPVVIINKDIRSRQEYDKLVALLSIVSQKLDNTCKDYKQTRAAPYRLRCALRELLIENRYNILYITDASSYNYQKFTPPMKPAFEKLFTEISERSNDDDFVSWDFKCKDLSPTPDMTFILKTSKTPNGTMQLLKELAVGMTLSTDTDDITRDKTVQVLGSFLCSPIKKGTKLCGEGIDDIRVHVVMDGKNGKRLDEIAPDSSRLSAIIHNLHIVLSRFHSFYYFLHNNLLPENVYVDDNNNVKVTGFEKSYLSYKKIIVGEEVHKNYASDIIFMISNLPNHKEYKLVKAIVKYLTSFTEATIDETLVKTIIRDLSDQKRIKKQIVEKFKELDESFGEQRQRIKDLENENTKIRNKLEELKKESERAQTKPNILTRQFVKRTRSLPDIEIDIRNSMTQLGINVMKISEYTCEMAKAYYPLADIFFDIAGERYENLPKIDIKDCEKIKKIDLETHQSEIIQEYERNKQEQIRQEEKQKRYTRRDWVLGTEDTEEIGEIAQDFSRKVSEASKSEKISSRRSLISSPARWFRKMSDDTKAEKRSSRRKSTDSPARDFSRGESALSDLATVEESPETDDDVQAEINAIESAILKIPSWRKDASDFIERRTLILELKLICASYGQLQSCKTLKDLIKGGLVPPDKIRAEVAKLEKERLKNLTRGRKSAATIYHEYNNGEMSYSNAKAEIVSIDRDIGGYTSDIIKAIEISNRTKIRKEEARRRRKTESRA